MTDTEIEVLPMTVGLLMWRPAPLGREVCALRIGGRSVLPKGLLRAQEDEPSAALRLARQLCAAQTGDLEPLAPPPGEQAAVSWWSVRWEAPLEEAGPRRVPIAWLRFSRAQVELARRGERELIVAQTPTRWQRALEWFAREATARQRRDAWRLDDLREELEALPDRSAGPDRPSWRTLALARLARAREALHLGDRAAHAAALAEARTLSLFGRSGAERAAAHRALLERSRGLAGDDRLISELLLTGDPTEPGPLVAVATRLDRIDSSAHRHAQDAREDRSSLASVLVVALLIAGVWGNAAWFGGTGSAQDPHLAVLLFGLVGGAISALLRPGPRPVLLRPLLGAIAAQLVFALVRSGVFDLGALAPGGWVLVAFLAGFGERLVTRPSVDLESPSRGRA